MPVESTKSADGDLTLQGRSVAGIFDSGKVADEAVEDLLARGWAREAVNVVYQETAAWQHRSSADTKAGQGIAAGATAGGVLGGVAGLVVGLGALAIPGVGPLIAAGPLAMALGGAATGAAMGGLAGSFAGMGIPDEHAQQYEAAVRQGGIFVSVRARDDEEARTVTRLLEQHGARAVNSYQSQL